LQGAELIAEVKDTERESERERECRQTAPTAGLGWRERRDRRLQSNEKGRGYGEIRVRG